MKKLISSWAVVALLVGISACQNQETATNPANAPTGTEAQSPASTTDKAKNQVTVQTREMAIDVSQKTLPAGETEFVIKNVGKVPHEVIFFKTDLALNQLPTTSDGKLNEDDNRLKELEEVEPDELTNGQVQTVRLNLTPGRYVLVCNIGNHFQQGMKTELTVK